MKISIPLFLVAAVNGNKVPALRGELTVTSDGTAGWRNCDIFRAQPGNIIDGCIRYGVHNDPQGMICGNDGEDNEAYCNYNNNPADEDSCIIGICGLTPEEVYDPQSWNELPSVIQVAYTTLGYSQWWWDNNFRTDATFSDWDELTNHQQEAMGTVGYTESSWDNSENGECGPSSNWGCLHSTEVGCIDRSAWGCTWTPSPAYDATA